VLIFLVFCDVIFHSHFVLVDFIFYCFTIFMSVSRAIISALMPVTCPVHCSVLLPFYCFLTNKHDNDDDDNDIRAISI